jgi:phage regulator Rha-like protein
MTYSTAQVAKLVGVEKSTLLRWLYSAKLREPRHIEIGGQVIRVWTVNDLERVRKFKEKNYRKGRGRKKKT